MGCLAIFCQLHVQYQMQFVPQSRIVSIMLYNAMLSTALSAVAGGMKLKAYIHKFASIGWHDGTYNELTGNGALYLIRCYVGAL